MSSYLKHAEKGFVSLTIRNYELYGSLSVEQLNIRLDLIIISQSGTCK